MVNSGTIFRENSAIKIIKRDVIECNLPFRGDTYDGCSHNCIYCYAREQQERWGNWFAEDPRPANIDSLRKRFGHGFVFAEKKNMGDTSYVNRAIEHRHPIRIGTETDPFQECEKNHRITYKFIKFLVKQNYPFLINTKSDLITEQQYVDLLKKAEHGSAVVQFTITTLNPEIKEVEAEAPSPQKRLDALKVLSENGIPTQIRYSPIIPTLDDDAEEVFQQATECGAKDVITEYLRLSKKANNRFRKILGVDLIEEVYEPNGNFSKNYYRLDENYRFDRYRSLKKTAKKYGLDLYVCSEENPSINDCENCCGTDKYPAFDQHNTAAANNIYKMLRELGKVTFSEVEDRLWNIHWKEFKKRWDNGELEDFLVNAYVKKENGEEIRDSEGHLVYENRGG